MSSISPVTSSSLLQQMSGTTQAQSQALNSEDSMMLQIVDKMDISSQAKQLAEQTIEQYEVSNGQGAQTSSSTSSQGIFSRDSQSSDPLLILLAQQQGISSGS